MSTAGIAGLFALVAAVGLSFGIVVDRFAASGQGAWMAIVATALATGALGFATVLILRSRTLRHLGAESAGRIAALEHEIARQRSLLDGAPDHAVVLDAQSGAVLTQNSRAREEFGVLQDLAERLTSADAAVVREAVADANRSVRRESSIPSLRVRTKSGSEIDCEARLAVIEIDERRVVHVALRDRTHERAAEHELAVRERLSSLGLLTAGVAHEINNPLEGIGNYVKLLARPDLAPEDRERHLGLVRHGFERIRDIVRDLLRFARPSGAEIDVDLVQVVDRARRMAAYSDSFRGVEFATVGLERPFVVLGDAGRLEQVVLNLFLNAAHAMQGRGRIVVTAHRWNQDARFVALAIADDGPGISPEHLERVFDPFFTTGGGTGLGLSIAYGILQAHGGTLAVRNRPEGGAEFTLRFPAALSKSSEEAA